MSPIGPLPSTVADDEILARYIDHRSDVRANQTLRPDPFIPYPYPELSVTRHKNLTGAEIWQFGEDFVAENGTTLYGRGDLSARCFREVNLTVEARSTDSNPNHAHAEQWPPDKPSQKMRAQKISKVAKYVPKPGP
jgi:hypothetical protein